MPRRWHRFYLGRSFHRPCGQVHRVGGSRIYINPYYGVHRFTLRYALEVMRLTFYRSKLFGQQYQGCGLGVGPRPPPPIRALVCSQQAGRAAGASWCRGWMRRRWVVEVQTEWGRAEACVHGRVAAVGDRMRRQSNLQMGCSGGSFFVGPPTHLRSNSTNSPTLKPASLMSFLRVPLSSSRCFGTESVTM